MMSLEQKACIEEFESIPYVEKDKHSNPEGKSIDRATSGLENFSLTVGEQARFDQESSLDIKIDDFTISTHRRYLFKNASLHIKNGRRYGLVGPNGMGKTTLLKHIATRSLKIPLAIKILYCEQEVRADDTSAMNAVLSADKKRSLLNEEQKVILSEPELTNENIERLKQITNELNSMKSDESELKSCRILAGLGFDKTMMKRATKNFSIEWRMRLSLARALFIEPTLLLLDEPTSYLDINAVIWLGNFLQYWKKTIILVSNDQRFMENVCTDIIQLENKKLNYLSVTEFKKQPQEHVVTFKFPKTQNLSPPIIGLKNVSFRYQKDWLFEDVNFSVDMKSRVALLGSNGVGKSTFLRLLLGDLEPSKGEVMRNRDLRLGYYDQYSVDQFDSSMTPVEYLKSAYNIDNEECRKRLESVGLPGFIHEMRLEQLSVGQKARVGLVDLLSKVPDVVILDEPTNNLDMDAIDGLIEALNNFDGGVVIVSHDERLIRDMNCQLYVVKSFGVDAFDGDFDDYRKKLLEVLGEKQDQSVCTNEEKKI